MQTDLFFLECNRGWFGHFGWPDFSLRGRQLTLAAAGYAFRMITKDHIIHELPTFEREHVATN